MKALVGKRQLFVRVPQFYRKSFIDEQPPTYSTDHTTRRRDATRRDESVRVCVSELSNDLKCHYESFFFSHLCRRRRLCWSFININYIIFTVVHKYFCQQRQLTGICSSPSNQPRWLIVKHFHMNSTNNTAHYEQQLHYVVLVSVGQLPLLIYS